MNKHHCLTKQEIEERLKQAGVQPTLQRIAIAQYILCEADHPTAEEVHSWADKNLAKISLATVYNTLNTLVAAGLLREFRFPHSEKVIYDNNLEEHFHFLDEKTQRLYDIPFDDVKVSLDLARKYKVQKVDVLFRGEFKPVGSKKEDL